MSDFLLADSFGNLSDGTHTSGVTREILGELWASYGSNFAIEDRGDGRKWMKTPDFSRAVILASAAWSSINTIHFGFRVITTTPGRVDLCHCLDGASVLGLIGFDASGHLVYCRSLFANSGVVHTSTATLQANTETYYEVEVLFDNAAGYVKVWKDGVFDSQTTGVDTINSGLGNNTSIRLFNNAATALQAGWKFSDFLVHVGTSPLGIVSTVYRPADGDGADTDFTPSAGADHYAMVDDIGPDEDTTYNESDGTSGHRDTYDCAALAGGTILSVCALGRARKDGASAGSLKVGVTHGGSDDLASGSALSTDYSTLAHYADVNPSTAAAWSLAEVNAAQAVVEVV